MNILVTGSTGQLGLELQEQAAGEQKHRFIFADRTMFDLSAVELLSERLSFYQPQLIINCAAYTAVDKAQTNAELADVVNHQAVRKIGEWARSNAAKVIHISTDYVFDGKSSTPLREDAPTAPINVYGSTKLLGEQALREVCPESVVVRTSWVYSTYGANFVKTMLRLMKEREQIGVVNDQIGSPTYAADLAKALLKIVDAPMFVPGVYHYSNLGQISWYEFACAIKEYAKMSCAVRPIASSEFPTPAPRPAYSLLSKEKIQQVYQVEVPHWENSLREMLGKLSVE